MRELLDDPESPARAGAPHRPGLGARVVGGRPRRTRRGCGRSGATTTRTPSATTSATPRSTGTAWRSAPRCWRWRSDAQPLRRELPGRESEDLRLPPDVRRPVVDPGPRRGPHDYLLMLGANPAASNGSLMTLGDVRGRLRAIGERGGKLVLFDPRRTETRRGERTPFPHCPAGTRRCCSRVLQVLFGRGARRRGGGREDCAGGCRGCGRRRRHGRRAGCGGDRRRAGDDPAHRARARRGAARVRVRPGWGRARTSSDPVASWLIEVLNVVTGNFDPRAERCSRVRRWT